VPEDELSPAEAAAEALGAVRAMGQAKHPIPQAKGLRHRLRCCGITGRRFGSWRGASAPGHPGTRPAPPGAEGLGAGAEAGAAADAQACPERREDFAGEERSSEGVEVDGLEVAAGPGRCRGLLVQEQARRCRGTLRLQGAAEQGVPDAVGEGRGCRRCLPTPRLHQLLHRLPLSPRFLPGALPAEPDHPDALATWTALPAEVLKSSAGTLQALVLHQRAALAQQLREARRVFLHIRGQLATRPQDADGGDGAEGAEHPRDGLKEVLLKQRQHALLLGQQLPGQQQFAGGDAQQGLRHGDPSPHFGALLIHLQQL